MTPLAIVFALLMGLVLGLLGGGGSILTVPVLVYVLGLDAKLAVVMSLPIIGGTALVGAVQHWRLGHIEVRWTLAFGAAAMLGAFGGARLSHFLTGAAQLVILATVMLGASGSMLRGALRGAPDEVSGRRSPPVLLASGAAVGVLTGLVGVGGGFLFVPALVILGGLQMSHAIGTSLLVIALNTAAAYAGHHGTVNVPWRLVIYFGAVAAVGILVGSQLTKRVPMRALKAGFAVFIAVVALLILWQNRGIF